MRIVDNASIVFMADELKEFTFSITKFNYPSSEISMVELSNPTNSKIEYYGTERIKEDLIIRFIVDDDHSNYFALKEYMDSILPEGKSRLDNTISTRVIITFYDSSNNPIYDVLFTNVRVKRVGGFVHDLEQKTKGALSVLKADASFNFIQSKRRNYNSNTDFGKFDLPG